MRKQVIGAGLAVSLIAVSFGTAQAAPQPLSAEQKRVFNGSEEDVLDKKPCIGTRKRVTLTCRDVRHYVRMNEWYHEIWRPYVDGIGGGFVGIASDQNLTFIAWAKSELAWLMDYDPVVVKINLIHKAFILASADAASFVKLWNKAGRKRAAEVLQQAYGERDDFKQIKRAYKYFRREIATHFKRVLRIKRRMHWLHDAEDYTYIREMHRQGRIRVMKGDLLKDKSLRGIGKAARELKVPIRIVYLSNAEEFWPYPRNFKTNFIELPMDSKSVILRTRHTKRYGPKIGSYVYVVQAGEHFQTKLKEKGTRGVWSLMKERKPGRPGFFTIGRPVHPESMAKRRRRRKKRL